MSVVVLVLVVVVSLSVVVCVVLVVVGSVVVVSSGKGNICRFASWLLRSWLAPTLSHTERARQRRMKRTRERDVSRAMARKLCSYRSRFESKRRGEGGRDVM